jgi:hypothetical protein
LHGRLRSATITAAVAPFNAEVVFRFEAESVEAAGAELRRLALAAATIGFELQEGRVEPRSPDAKEGEGWTGYAPLDEPPRPPPARRGAYGQTLGRLLKWLLTYVPARRT